MILNLTNYVVNKKLPNEQVLNSKDSKRPFIINGIIEDRSAKKETTEESMKEVLSFECLFIT